MATYNKFNDFTEQLTRGLHDFGSNTFKVMLTNVAPAAANAAKADITEIAAGNGYTIGGNTTTITVAENPAGTSEIKGTAVPFNATGAMAQFRYAVLYNATTTTPVNNPLVAWWDYGSAVNLQNGDSFTVKFSNTDPGIIFTLV
jgi:hypothetical protein